MSEGQQNLNDELHHDDEDDIIYNRDTTEPITEDAESIVSEQENSKYESEEETA